MALGSQSVESRSEKRWFQDPVALSALLLSVVISLINAYYVIRHSEIVVQPPEQILFYRDGDVVVAAVQLSMMNVAGQDHGDMLKSANIEMTGASRFRFESAVEPIITQEAETVECELQLRCIRFDNMIVLQKWNQVFDLPGGAANARYLSFPLSAVNCEGLEDLCLRYSNPDPLGSVLPSSGETLKIRLSFSEDGEREISCEIDSLEQGARDYFERQGWVTTQCSRSDVSGAPIL